LARIDMRRIEADMKNFARGTALLFLAV